MLLSSPDFFQVHGNRASVPHIEDNGVVWLNSETLSSYHCKTLRECALLLASVGRVMRKACICSAGVDQTESRHCIGMVRDMCCCTSV